MKEQAIELTESISELRRICQRSRESQFYQLPWLEIDTKEDLMRARRVIYPRMGRMK